MEKLEFETSRHRIGKAFGRPPIAPAPVVIEVKATPWGEPRVHLNGRPRSWGGVGAAALCAAACLALIVGARGHLTAAAPFNATAPAAETWVDDDGATSMPDHVTGDALDDRCEKLWTVLNAQDDIRVAEGAKPGFTRAYKAASHLEYATALQIRAQGCPIKDQAVFDKELETIRALDSMIDSESR